MSVLDTILAKEPEQRDVEFCMDRGLREALATAQAELEELRRKARRSGLEEAEAKELAHKIDEAHERAQDLAEHVQAKLVRFTFAALNPSELDALKAEHEPTREQRQAAQQAKESAPEWNVDTFPPALLAASCVRVEGPDVSADGLTLEEALAVWESRAYNSAERAALFHTALAASLTRTPLVLPRDDP